MLNLLAERLSDKEIAQRLVISLNTVRTHTKGIFSKLNVKNRRQAVTLAIIHSKVEAIARGVSPIMDVDHLPGIDLGLGERSDGHTRIAS